MSAPNHLEFSFHPPPYQSRQASDVMRPRRSTKSTQGMRNPLGFGRQVRAASAGKSPQAGQRVFFENLRTVNVVVHTQTLSGPPGPWAGYVPRGAVSRHSRACRQSSNFTQQRQTVDAGTGGGNKRAVLLVFRNSTTGEPTSKILAGSASVAAALGHIYRYEAANGVTGPGNSAICVHNVVVSAAIRADGLELSKLSESPLVVSTTKFPGGIPSPRIRQCRCA